MVYNNFILMGVGSTGASALSHAAVQLGGLTQGLVVLVILVVIALALIFVCGLMGRRGDEELPPVSGGEKIEPAVTEATSPAESVAEPVASAVKVEEVTGEVEVTLAETPALAEAEVEPELPGPEPDDLKRIEGIGPKVSSLLNEAGIFTFAQLADAEVPRLKSIVDEAGLTMMNPASWPDQARLAASGDWDALAKLQEGLKAGRHA